MKVVLTTLNAKYTHTSLGLRYLREYCREFEEIEIMEFSINNQLLDILGQIYEKTPDILGFGCYIWNIEMIKHLIPMVRQVLPACRIVCGGPEISYETEAFMQQLPMVDYVIRGEGEQSFLALLRHLTGGSDEGLPAGIARRSAAGDMLAGSAAAVEDFAKVQFPYRDEEMPELKEKILYYESSRGCPFACKYCLSCASKGVRYLPVARVLEELAFFIRHEVRQVKFVDRTFNASKEHFMPILRFLAAQDCRTNFHFEVAVDYMDEDVLEALRQMPEGRVQLEIGIQSTNQQTLSQVSRVNHWEKIAYNIKRILSFGNMHLHVDLIIGLPTEDIFSFEKSFNDVYALQPDMLQLGFLKFLKGAAMMELAAEHGYVYMQQAPYQVLANNYLNYGQIRWLHTFEDVFERYYNAGRFGKTMAYLIKASGGNAFTFYSSLTNFWEQRGLHLVAHTTKSLYRYLLEFSRGQYPQAACAAAELLKLDALLSDGGSIRPECLKWNDDQYQSATAAFWRGGRAECYIENYVFTNWRQLRRQYHIEVFSFDMEALAGGQSISHETALLFDYTAAKAAYQVIELGEV